MSALADRLENEGGGSQLERPTALRGATKIGSWGLGAGWGFVRGSNALVKREGISHSAWIAVVKADIVGMDGHGVRARAPQILEAPRSVLYAYTTSWACGFHF